MDLTNEKDKILSYLSNRSMSTLLEMSSALDITYDRCRVACSQLEQDECIRVFKDESYTPNGPIAQPESYGRELLREGGYKALQTKQVEREKQLEKENRWEKRYKKATIAVATLSAIITAGGIYLGYRAETSKRKIEVQEKTIDSLSRKIHQLDSTVSGIKRFVIPKQPLEQRGKTV